MSNTEMLNSKNKFGLTNNQLKIIAMISMIIDHVGVALFPGVEILRILGRISLPIYAYMIAEGCKHTKNRKKYFGMIAIMAVIFQLFYWVFMNDLYQGILVTFSLSIAIIFSVDTFFKSEKILTKILSVVSFAAALFFAFALPEMFGDKGFYIDYEIWGIFLPVIVYYAPNKWWKLGTTLVWLVAMAIISSSLQWWSLMALPFLALYNGERGKAKMKYFFYILYPLHLVLIYIAAFIMVLLKN